MATPTTQQLRNAVTEIDTMAQGAFSEIAAIAKLALATLETPAAYIDPESMAILLNAIWGKAIDAENYINVEAEGVGCNYIDQAERRRSDARRKAREAASSGVTV